jgi:hypothetical protein
MSDQFLTEEAPKDRWGRYLVQQPEGKPRGYTRVTTVAKTLDDTASLADWKVRMAITGLVQRPDLLAQASTSIDDRARLNKIANDCVEASGGYSRANLGTALHAITEQIDLGLKPAILPGLQADIDAYIAGIAAYGIKMHDEFIEVLLINDELEYAGTADRIVTLMDGRLVIFDLKTGTDLSYSYGNIAVQLAMYANAEWMYNWKTGERQPMPDLDKTVGIICHLPAGDATVNFHEVNLVAGWDAAKQSFATREWRKRKDLFKPYTFSDKPRTPTARKTKATEIHDAIDKIADVIESPKSLTARAGWMKARIQALTVPAQKMLVLSWPVGVPHFDQCTNEHFDALVRVIELVEAEHSAPFFEPDPTKPKLKRRKIVGFDDADISFKTKDDYPG